ncbi:MAG: hypothetical protein GY774_31480 [Planctomycetes bacterium]|nr:hypothetical protein [Planctomycetota bacterium]
MTTNKAKNWIRACSVVLLAGSLILFDKDLKIATVLCIYSVLWLCSGIGYNAGHLSYWFAVIFTIPWASLFFYQFARRLFYLFAYGGESPGGRGSPLLFLAYWIIEMPGVILMAILCYFLVIDFITYLNSRKGPSLRSG